MGDDIDKLVGMSASFALEDLENARDSLETLEFEAMSGGVHPGGVSAHPRPGVPLGRCHLAVPDRRARRAYGECVLDVSEELFC